MTQSTTGGNREFSDFQASKSGVETTETTTTWNTKLSRTFKRVPAGTYQITWSTQYYVVSGASTRCEVRFMKDGTRFGSAQTQDGDTNEQTATCVQTETYTRGSQPEITIGFRRQGGAGTVGVKRCVVTIVRVGD